MFRLTASCDGLERSLGPFSDFQKRTASEKDQQMLDLFPFFTDLIKHAASIYDISDDPKNYVFAQVRALHADKVNGNGDRARKSELVQYRPGIGSFVFKSFVGKPHLEEHDDTDLRASHGILVNSSIHLNEHDKPIRVLVAVDTKKNKKYADDLLGGKPVEYSMGCLAAYTVCDHCSHLATTDEEWCDHMRSWKGRWYMGKLMSESIYGVEYQELSRVASAADKGAKREKVLGMVGGNPKDTDKMRSLQEVIRKGLGQFGGRCL